jgi:outer membrane protein assembly factor BamA
MLQIAKIVFFNISEVGADMKLSFPKILFPINTEKYIPNYMSPFTTLSVGVSTQQNIGLDKQNVTGAFSYRWQPKKTLTHQLDLLNVQYVRNLNTGNYFNVYRNSFNILNDIAQNNNDVNPAYFNTNEDGTSTLIIPEGANSFINDALSNNIDNLTTDELQDINNINERQDRLTEDNLIFASNFSYVYDNRDNLYDNDFSRFRGKIEFAGNTLSTIASSIGLEENNTGGYNIFGVRFSQYAKLELDYIKHWDWGNKNIFAIRTFGGIAIPYGNSESIPFSRSFFAGGTNDNRGWQAYDLGPGSTGGRNEFNEANMKLHFSGEYRFNLFGQLNSALFVDVGNIWNVLDNVDDEDARFTSLSDLSELAVGSGFGLRYDVNFFVIRFDIGFKTYNPALTEGDRWFKQYNFANAVYNVGINYPF